MRQLQKSEWSKWLKTEANRLIKEVTNAILTEFEAVSVKTEEMIARGEVFGDMLTCLSSKSEITETINEFYDNRKPLFEGLNDCVLFDRKEIS